MTDLPEQPDQETLKAVATRLIGAFLFKLVEIGRATREKVACSNLALQSGI